MRIEVGQDAEGEWAWLAVHSGRLLASADGFESAEDAMANATRWIGDLAEWEREIHQLGDQRAQ